MLLVLDKMLRLFDFVVTAGGPVSVVWRMLANLLPEYFSLGIPIGLMLGILLAFRKLALSSELDALRGIGVGLRPPAARPLRLRGHADAAEPVRSSAISSPTPTTLRRACASTCARARSARRSRSASSTSSAASSPSGSTEAKSGDRSFTASSSRSTTGRARRVAATAEQGRFLSTDDPDTILFRLHNGRLIQDSPKFPTPRTLAFDSYDLPITLPRDRSVSGSAGMRSWTS